QVGRGLGFGLHEALDQVGAVGGPLLVWVILSWQKGYQAAFAILFIPALVGLAILLIAQKIYPNPREFEARTMEFTSGGLPRLFWIYLVAVALIACGYTDFPLIAFHFQQIGLMEDKAIPLFYAVAMATDAIAAILFGRWFDRSQVMALAGAAIVAAFFAPLSFLGNPQLALVGIGLWGVGMGAQESILKATVALMVPMDKRGSAFGIFYLCYGLAWFAGSTLMGVLYDRSAIELVIFSLVTQLAAVPVLLWVSKRFHLTQSVLDC
ncbi:MAG: MFS transporter, partial [Fischerella sp.]|nr:MFS transporter [Fischerella sp.]